MCAKCLKSADVVNIEPPEATPEEQLQLKVEMDRLVKLLPERKRRTFLRFMKKGKEMEQDDDNEEGKSLALLLQNFLFVKTSNRFLDGDDTDKVKEKVRIPHSRTDLLNKFESLKVAENDDEEDEDDGEDYESDIDFEDGSLSDESS